MRTRTNRAVYGFASAWLLALCAVLGLAFGNVKAAGPDSEQAGDVAGPQSLVPGKSIAVTGGQPEALAPTVGTCSGPVVLFDGSASGNGRSPSANFAADRGHYLILQSELAAAGITGTTSISGIGWRYDALPGVAATANLRVYLENAPAATVANAKSATWATAISTMTLVHNASTTLPNSTVGYDIPFSGAAFNYTGGALYVAYDWGPYGGTLSTTPLDVSCNSTGVASRERQANTAAATLGALSNFGPETRLTATVNSNDAGVVYVISLGSLAQPLVGQQTVQAVITNKGANALTNLPVTLNITGADTFSNMQNVASLAACGATTTVTFAPFTPGAIGSDTVAVSVPADDNAANNSASRPLNETFNLYSYKHPGTTAAGGVGVTGNTADFVAKFTTTVAAKVSAVNLEFPAATTTTYRVAIYPDSGSGTPGLVPLYEDAADRTVGAIGPVTITLPTPIAVGPGNFFAGIQQRNTVNAGLSFDNETPIRAGAFYLAVPHPAAAWTDFAPGTNFKLNIGVTLIQCNVAADCNDNNSCTNDACTNNLCVYTPNNTTNCDGNSCSDPDSCVNGVCIPGPNPCNDNNACTVDLCAGGGGCTYSPVDCNDNNACTDDFCLPQSGCGHSNNTAACSDGNPCTIGDTCSAGACVPGSGALPAPVRFCNQDGVITINDNAAASPYPSSIVVTGLPSYVCSVTVDLNGITHTFPDDIDVLLARLAGGNAIVMSDVGGGTDILNVNLTLSDAAATSLPDAGPLVSGTFKPTNIGTGDVFPAPAPAPSGGSALSVFNGTNPNGTWNLWVVDAFAQDFGSMSGWCVNLVAACGVNADCDDGNVCTSDTCSGGLCSHVNNNPCDDGNPCTVNQCNPQSGQCENPPLVCNDNNACTDDSCSVQSGCVFTPNNNNVCSDNSLCTTPDVCQNGVCVGQNPVICTPDANACTTEACNPATGQCQTTNNTNPCDDGNPCTTGDQCGPALAENFDGVTPPDLPLGWSTSNSGGSPWVTVATSFDTPPNSAFGTDGSTTADEVLVSPLISVVSATAQLTFRNRWRMEQFGGEFFDGAVLEIDIAGGGFVDILDAGGSFVSGGYTGTIAAGTTNPLESRDAWVGDSAGYPAYVTTVVNLPAAAMGQPVQLQWRVGSDEIAGATGQNIDSILLLDGTNTCQPGTGTLDCNDGNPCTDDYCDAQLACQHSNNVDACNDGNACTVLDLCNAGACAGNTITCDDSNPCTLDSCDTQTGCVFAPITAPTAEAQNVAVGADKQTYTWSPVASATRYDVVRGSTAAFPVGPGLGDEVCFDNLGGPSLSDPAAPALGSGFWYLSRGENTCGNGPYGNQGVNGAPGAPRVSTTCP